MRRGGVRDGGKCKVVPTPRSAGEALLVTFGVQEGLEVWRGKLRWGGVVCDQRCGQRTRARDFFMKAKPSASGSLAAPLIWRGVYLKENPASCALRTTSSILSWENASPGEGEP